MANDVPAGRAILPYDIGDGIIPVEVVWDGAMWWATQQQTANVFGVDRRTIGEHIQNIFGECELTEQAVCRKFRHTASDGKTYEVLHYNLDMVIAVGYRVSTSRGTRFRQWATSVLSRYSLKGYALDDERLSSGYTGDLDGLVERVRRIRTSEAPLDRKLTDLFTTSIDYDAKSSTARRFFASIHNKFHYAIHQHTAPELIVNRVNHKQPNMGLTNWRGRTITKRDSEIAKNYLGEFELELLELLVEQFLVFAEFRAKSGISMLMVDWLKKLDDFLAFNERPILLNKGAVTHQQAMMKAHKEFAQFKNHKLGSGVA